MLTLFPDGEGYMDHVWNGMTELQQYTLTSLFVLSRCRYDTLLALRRRGLVQDGKTRWVRSERGDALIRWAHMTRKI